MCFARSLDNYLADLKIKFDHEASLNYSEFNYTKLNTPQNIDFDGELSVEANDIRAQDKSCEYMYSDQKESYVIAN